MAEFMDAMRAKQLRKTVDARVDNIVDKMKSQQASAASLQFTDGTLRAFYQDLATLATNKTVFKDVDIADLVTNIIMSSAEGEEFSVIGDRVQAIINETASTINEVLSAALEAAAD